MSLESNLFDALKGLVSNRVYPDVAPYGAALPHITYQQIGGRAINFLESGVPGKRNARVQINVWATTRTAAATLSRQAEEALITSANLKAFVLSAAYARFDLDVQQYGTNQDFSIWF